MDDGETRTARGRTLREERGIEPVVNNVNPLSDKFLEPACHPFRDGHNAIGARPKPALLPGKEGPLVPRAELLQVEAVADIRHPRDPGPRGGLFRQRPGSQRVGSGPNGVKMSLGQQGKDLGAGLPPP